MKAHSIADDIPDEHIKAVAKELVNWAYTEPRYSSYEFRENAAIDFGTEVYNNCKKATENKK